MPSCRRYTSDDYDGKVKSEEEKSELKKRKRDENEKAPFYSILFIKETVHKRLNSLPSTSSLLVWVSCSKDGNIVTSARS